jgi:hypothetical protein
MSRSGGLGGGSGGFSGGAGAGKVEGNCVGGGFGHKKGDRESWSVLNSFSFSFLCSFSTIPRF